MISNTKDTEMAVGVLVPESELVDYSATVSIECRNLSSLRRTLNSRISPKDSNCLTAHQH